MVERRVDFLTAYQSAAYAARYRRLVEKARAVEAARAPGKSGLADAVARYLFKLMAYKDEYEVARLYADEVLRQAGRARARRREPAPPRASRSAAPRPPRQGDGRAEEDDVRAVDLPAVRRCWRNSSSCAAPLFDPFGYSTERKTERALVRDYETMLEEVFSKLDADNHHIAVGLAAIPEKIRGFGHVKMRHLGAAKADEAALLDQFRAGPAPLLKAAE